MSVLVVGVDPGLTTGVCAITCYRQRVVSDPAPVLMQVYGDPLPAIGSLLERAEGPRLLAVEAFVVGPRAGRSASAHAGRHTRQLIPLLQDLAEELGAEWVSRTAAAVKPWATDTRLAAVSLLDTVGDAAGLIPATKGMPHARDAARHAVYAAVHAGHLRDPLLRAKPKLAVVP